MFTGRKLTAEEAQPAGWVTRIVQAEDLDDALAEIAKTIVAAPAARCVRPRAASIKASSSTPAAHSRSNCSPWRKTSRAIPGAPACRPSGRNNARNGLEGAPQRLRRCPHQRDRIGEGRNADSRSFSTASSALILRVAAWPAAMPTNSGFGSGSALSQAIERLDALGERARREHGRNTIALILPPRRQCARDLEPLRHGLVGRAAQIVHEACGAQTVVGEEVHHHHAEAGAGRDQHDVAVDFDELEAEVARFALERGEARSASARLIGEFCRVMAEIGAVVADDLGVAGDQPPSVVSTSGLISSSSRSSCRAMSGSRAA